MEGYSTWSQEEKDAITEHFPKGRKKLLLETCRRKDWISIKRKAREMGIINPNKGAQKYTINSQFFKTWTEESAWALGFIVADGHIKKGRPDRDERQLEFELADYDKDILLKLKNAMSFTGPVRHSKRNTVKLGISNKEIIDDLMDLGIPLIGKTENQKWPLILPPEMYPHFIRGVIDGDGSFYKDGSIRIQILGTKDILENIATVIPVDFNLDHIHNRNKYGGANVHILRVGAKKALILLRWIYSDANIYSQRKLEKASEIVNTLNELQLRSTKYGAFFKLRELLEHMASTPKLISSYHNVVGNDKREGLKKEEIM